MLVPLLVSNGVALLVILAALKWPRVTRVGVGVGFTAAACFNLITVLTQPHSYVEGFGPLALSLYQRFIYGPFAKDPRLFVLPIAFGQLAAGLLILCPFRRAVRAGLAGGIVFLVVITPLGFGSAFPSPLLFAAALALLMRPVRGGTA